jgi:hypothetical protein
VSIHGGRKMTICYCGDNPLCHLCARRRDAKLKTKELKEESRITETICKACEDPTKGYLHNVGCENPVGRHFTKPSETTRNFEEIAYKLFKLLDDIDTTYDMGKGNDQWTLGRIDGLHKKRFELLTQEEIDNLYVKYHKKEGGQ